jgi:dTDP-4-amino-4,6-dideoxygalactose transaminase
MEDSVCVPVSPSGDAVQPTVVSFANGVHFRRGRVAQCAILKAFGIGSGDEVIIQAFTCVAVPCPVLATDAKPVFADIDPATFNLDPASVEACITPRTRAIVVQHTFGIPADMDRILRTARSRGIYVIEDCCHTLASSYRGVRVGSLGDAAFCAYRWGKPLVLGIGGTAIIHAEEPRKRLREISRYSRIPGILETARIRMEYLAHELLLRPSLFWLLRDGYRSLIKMGVAIPTFPKLDMQGELSDMDKAMPLFHQKQLAKRIGSAFEEDAAFRRRRAGQYAAALDSIGARTAKLDERYDPVYLRYPFLVTEKARILEQARKHRVELGDWFVSAVHPHADSESEELGYRQGMCPAAERTAKQILTLPSYDKVRERDVERAIELLNSLHREGLL